MTGTAVEAHGQSLGLTQINAVQAGISTVTPALAPASVRTMAYPDNDADREAHESESVKLSGGFTVTNSFNTNSFGEIGLATGSGPLRPADRRRRAQLRRGQGAGRAERPARRDPRRRLERQLRQTTPNTNPALPVADAATAGPGVPTVTPVRVGATATLAGQRDPGVPQQRLEGAADHAGHRRQRRRHHHRRPTPATRGPSRSAETSASRRSTC